MPGDESFGSGRSADPREASREAPLERPEDAQEAEILGEAPIEAADEAATPEHDQRWSATGVEQGLASLDLLGRRGANWFYWVAALSLVNTAMAMSDADRRFVIGLGITQIVDGVAREIGKQRPEAASVAHGIAIGFDCFVALVVCLFGWLSKKRFVWIFALGMVLYLLDGLIFLLVQEWVGVALHAYILFSMWKGISAYRQFNALLRSGEAA
jgi:hypothetical protein